MGDLKSVTEVQRAWRRRFHMSPPAAKTITSTFNRFVSTGLYKASEKWKAQRQKQSRSNSEKTLNSDWSLRPPQEKLQKFSKFLICIESTDNYWNESLFMVISYLRRLCDLSDCVSAICPSISQREIKIGRDWNSTLKNIIYYYIPIIHFTHKYCICFWMHSCCALLSAAVTECIKASR